MEVAITKMSKNGQVVIPSEIREDAKLEAYTKFLVFNEGGNILLKVIKKEQLKEDMELIEQIERCEQQIKKGKFVKANSHMTDDEIDNLLMTP